jgi:hypothetical protein
MGENALLVQQPLKTTVHILRVRKENPTHGMHKAGQKEEFNTNPPENSWWPKTEISWVPTKRCATSSTPTRIYKNSK